MQPYSCCRKQFANTLSAFIADFLKEIEIVYKHLTEIEKYDIILSWIAFIFILLLEVISNHMQPYSCCRKQFANTLSAFIADFLKEIEIVYKHLTEIHPL